MTQVGVVRTGTANLASVLAALDRLGATPMLLDSAEQVGRADRLVLPGVGAFAAAMSRLEAQGVADAVRAHVIAGKPFLGICLGMQLLAEGSAESPGARGLAVSSGHAVRLPGSVRVPQLGWNRVTWSDRRVADGHAYFANSYCLMNAPSGWQAATSNHGGPFIAAIAREAQLACQFHPELSGPYGAAVLQHWWAAC